MLKETETEETVGLFVTFLSLVTFQMEGGGGAGSVGALLTSPMYSGYYIVYYCASF